MCVVAVCGDCVWLGVVAVCGCVWLSAVDVCGGCVWLCVVECGGCVWSLSFCSSCWVWAPKIRQMKCLAYGLSSNGFSVTDYPVTDPLLVIAPARCTKSQREGSLV